MSPVGPEETPAGDDIRDSIKWLETASGSLNPYLQKRQSIHGAGRSEFIISLS